MSFFVSSCHTSDKQNPIKEFSPIWEYNFDIGYFLSINPILHNDLVVYSGLDERKTDFSANSTLEAFNKKDGELIWKWSDNVKSSYDQFSVLNNNVVYNDILYISSGWEYAVNLNSGNTSHQGNNEKYNGSDFFLHDNKLFSLYLSDDEKVSTVETSSVNEFQWNVIFELNNDKNNKYLDHLIFDNSNSSLIYIPYYDWDGQKSRSYLLVYNLETKQIELDKEIDLIPGNHFVDYLPILDHDEMFISAHGIIASINKKDGSVNWQFLMESFSSRSGITVDESSVYANTESRLYSFDKETGKINWSIPSLAGSRLLIHKGILYYVGGPTLNAVDIVTGEILLSHIAPSYKYDRGAFFQAALTIDYENDLIYAASYTHAYCYPTLR